MKKCKNCAWFCHFSQKCYAELFDEDLAVRVDPENICKDWSFDGLSDSEREEYVLMTMEMTINECNATTVTVG